MSDLSQVTDKTFDETVVNSDMPVMVEFWAEWCKPCKTMTPGIEELARKYEGRIVVVTMNVAENHEIPARFGIRSIPALVFFNRGDTKQIIVGAHPMGYIEEELKKFI